MSGTLEDLKDVMMDMALWIKFNAWLTFISLVVFFVRSGFHWTHPTCRQHLWWYQLMALYKFDYYFSYHR